MKKIKIGILIFLLIIFVSLLPINNGNNLITIVSNTIESKRYQSSLDEKRQENYNKMKIDYVNVKTRVTGTEPFNVGNVSNNQGVDVSGSDNYVRTFDIVKYTLDLGISSNTSVSGVTDSSTFTGGVIKVRAKLPNQGDLVLMTWEQDAWMQNVSYNEDKTEIYAEYHVPDGISITNANQNLTFTVKVGGYKKDVTSEMAPEFEVWMEGNSPDDKTSDTSSVIVKDSSDNLIISGKPSFDVALKTSTFLYNGTKDSIDGYYAAYGIGVSLIQPESNFSDLRGVEYPTGTFEVELENTYLARDVLNSSSDYITIDENTPNSYGVLNNTEVIAYGINGSENSDYYPNSKVYTRELPYGIGGGDKSVTNSGTMNLSMDGTITTISFSNYELDGKYPIRHTYAADNVINYPSNIGYFATGNVQLFMPYYNPVNTIDYNYSYNVKVKSIKYKDTNGNEYEMDATSDGDDTNNELGIGFTEHNLKGNFYVMTLLKNNNGNQTDGLASSTLEGYIYPMFTLMPVDGPYEGGAERLITWNANYFTLVQNNGSWADIECYSELGFACPTKDSIDIKYGILKENPGEGITNEDDVNYLEKDKFEWYDTAEEASLKGKITAVYGYDHEVVGNRVHRRIKLKLQVTSNEDLIGTVGTMAQRVIIYGDEEKTQVFTPYKTVNYIATEYSGEGAVTVNHSPASVGASVLVLGAKTNITTSVSDLDSTGELKKAYDVKDNEINVELTLSITNDKPASDNDKVIDLVTVTSTLPKGLSYKVGSANKEPKSVIVNEDGTTDIIWEYDDWQINHQAPEYSKLTYQAEISASLENNTSLVISSEMFSKEDLRDVQFRTSEYGVIISNLSGSRAIKAVNDTVIEPNQSFIVTDTIGNTSQETLDNVKTIEILPVNDDENGSEFNGSYSLKVNSLSENQKMYYTTNNVNDIGITIDQNGKKTIKDVDLVNDSRWIEAQVGDEIPKGATAIATMIDKVEPSVEISYSYEVVTNNNKANDTYTFVMNVTSDNMMSAIKTNTVVVKVVSRNIEGIAFIDVNDNNVYDDEDKLLDNTEVSLLDSNQNVISTTKTDTNGIYSFDNLDKGNYYIKFTVGNNYNIIAKGNEELSSKVDANGVTDLVSQNSDSLTANATISNINLGVSLKEGNVIVHHYIDGTKESLSSDVVKTYKYGDEYSTVAATDIPKNYELKSKSDNYTGTINKDNTDVIYYYQKKESSITSSLTKTGTDEITSKDSKISYTILYESSINDYIGDGTITIVDYLPYEIDENNSNLDGGVYDSETKTITWVEEIIDIDTYQNIKNNIQITKNIEVIYQNIEVRDIVNKVIGTITLDNNEKKAESSKDTKIKIPSTILTHYYLEGTTNKLATSELSSGLVGERYDSVPKQIEGYELLKQTRQIYIYEEEQQVIIYEYRKIDNPKTIDNITKYILLFVGSIIILITAGVGIRKKIKHN